MSTDQNLPAKQVDLPDYFDELVSAGSKQFLKRVALMQALSKPVSAGSPEGVRAGDWLYGYGDKALIAGERKNKSDKDEGGTFTAIPLAMRPHALLMQDDKVEAESFDPASAEFKAIKEENLDKSKKKQGRNPTFGIDFLLFIVELNEFAVYYMCKTAKQEAPEVVKRMGKPCTFTARQVGKKNKWFVPRIKDTVLAQEPIIEAKKLQLVKEAFTVKFATVENEDEMVADAEGTGPGNVR